jgi:hypothetical protein
MSDLPEVDTFRAFFVLLLGAALGAVLMYAWDMTVGKAINQAIARTATAGKVAA